ncbi:hypothetical protein FACS189454_05670 [Planctomycetales bacterium]|nr:hypothetical protein FACS189454_05670 [Planctomycetales bacterium]
MARKISPGRKLVYYSGMALMGVGILMFLSTFLTFAMHQPFTEPPSILGAIFGVVLVGIGQVLMVIGRVGLAGSGIILDPERARDEQEPFSRMKGGMIRDGLDEAGLLDDDGLKLGHSASPQQPVVMIRCRGCGKLNEEYSKFCQECGEKL